MSMGLKEKTVKTEFGYIYRNFYIERSENKKEWIVFSKNFWDACLDRWDCYEIHCRTMTDCIAWINDIIEVRASQEAK
jgi:hypothetical protein